MSIDSETMKVISSLDCIKAGIVSLNKKLNVLQAEADWRKSRYETNFAQENVITANSSYTTASVNNPNYNRARIQIAAVFDSGASGGIELSMVFQNSMIGEIVVMKCSNGSAGMITEPINVKELSSFQIQIFNRDTSKSATLRRVRVILYNDY
jgi:hypothetical protein